MREHFGHYYQRSDAELVEIWTHAIVVLDANVLLNLYRYTPSTRDELLSVLRKTREQLWLPHQGPRQCYALPLPPRQLPRQSPKHVAKAQEISDLPGRLLLAGVPRVNGIQVLRLNRPTKKSPKYATATP